MRGIGVRGRRGSVGSVTFLLTGVIASAGCSLLVDFQDKPSPPASQCDDGATCDVAAAGDDGGAPPPDDGAPADTSSVPDAGHDASACPDPCYKRSGWYCGINGLACTASPDTLFHCVDGSVGTQTDCSGKGIGCAQLPSGYPDTCDPCAGLGPGSYCGKDLGDLVSESQTKNANFLFACQGGGLLIQSSKACAAGCSGTPGSAKCN